MDKQNLKIKKEPKYLTADTFKKFEKVFEKDMDFMAKSFNKVFEKLDKHDERFDRHDKVFDIMLKEMQTYSKEAREHRMTMSGLNYSDISQEKEIKGLKIRIEKLEEKVM